MSFGQPKRRRRIIADIFHYTVTLLILPMLMPRPAATLRFRRRRYAFHFADAADAATRFR